MNILILSWRAPGHPIAGGAEQVTFEHAKTWLNAGHNITWFTSYYKNAKREETVDGIKIIRRGRQFFDVHIRAFFWYLLSRKHPKFDLVVDEFHGIPFFTPLYVRVRKLAFIHEVAKNVWKLNPWPKPFSYIPAYIGTRFEPWVFMLIYKNIPFMTVSESTKAELEEWGVEGKKVTVVHNGVKLNKMPKVLPKKEKKKTAIFLGAISKDKGIFDALKIFAGINRKDDQWQYWVVGKGTKKYLNELKSLARELKIFERVKFFGFVSDGKKFDLLAKSHILINPSAREGWGLVNIEANAVGTPVIGYNVAGLKDSVLDGKTGLLVKEGDTGGVAEKALRLLNDEKGYAEMRKKTMKWSRNFTWEKSGRQSLELIESI